ncbi:pentatricopeptide repeat-containing protein At4g35130, chloroplastic [Eucalyptus grandis]|uniref:pentatricopeptide repeat-containing protein At4g35130, chloroplastic n=1 Tax=Eucalyptus grandis TaxID=71139 RepID=UPI00192EDC84|nr:pentatricopeptide repeat-containing protein At4g35130, chloroplastic [Eucalyptus grandis]
MASALAHYPHFYNSATAPRGRPIVDPGRISKPAAAPNGSKPNKLRRQSQADHFALNRALSAFVDSGSLENAVHLFENMPRSDAYSWNVLIRGFVNNGLVREAIELYRRMGREGIRADNYTYPFVVKACGGLLALMEGEKVHAKLFKVGLDLDLYVGNSLISMYAENGRADLAEKVFREMGARDVVSWNSMISGFLSVGDGWSSFALLREMQVYGMRPDRYSLISALGAASLESYLQSGKEIHCWAIRSGLESDLMVETSLVDMYCKCGKVDYAERLFDSASKENIVIWNAMIDGYASNALPSESLACVKCMQDDCNLNPDSITMINLLPACAQLGSLQVGKSVHGHSVRKGFFPNMVLETALINMYGASGGLKEAKYLFGKMAEKSLISWNAIIAAHVQNRQNEAALGLFQKLWCEPLEPDAITIASVLPAFAEVALLREGRLIHAYALKLGLGSNIYISNSIIYMYAKCGDLGTAQQIFDKTLIKDVVSWNVIIMAYAIHGCGGKSIALFKEMKKYGVEPNASTFFSLLMSCSISGLVDEGWGYFNQMRRSYNIDPGIEHYGCVLDLIGRTGNLDHAREFVAQMPLVPNARIWGSLLTASRKHGNIEMAEYAAKHILSLEHDNTGCCILLSNMYAEAGRWEDFEGIKSIMKKEGIKKTVGYSMMESRGKIYSFTNYDKCCQHASMIYGVLDIVSKWVGVNIHPTRVTRFRPLDLAKERAKSPATHSVRLAISFGLVSTAIGNPILIRQNTRICEDCHSAAKKISDLSCREIIVVDVKVVHHFRDRCCSCNDYW